MRFLSALIITICCFAQAIAIEFYSQASQDRFVHTLLYDILDKQDAGFYLEIGAGSPVFISNTYTLEKNHNWHGVSLDISDQCAAEWRSTRSNPLLIQNALTADYRAILAPFPRVIDYLSLDIDNEYANVLRRIPFDQYTFKIITIEHDFYRYGDVHRKAEREILSALGYYLLCPDVHLFYNGINAIFEDWWVHPSALPAEVFAKLNSLDLATKNHAQIVNTLQRLTE